MGELSAPGVRKERIHRLPGGDERSRQNQDKAVRWPFAKKEKYREFDKSLVMVSVRDDDQLSDIFAIDYYTWAEEGSVRERAIRESGEKCMYIEKEEKNHSGQSQRRRHTGVMRDWRSI